MIYYVDIDDTICTNIGNNKLDYSTCIPIIERIQKINLLHSMGNHIIYWTARGTVTGLDWSEVTRKQLQDWGAKYDSLLFGKPSYDYFIDDKAFNSNWWFQNE